MWLRSVLFPCLLALPGCDSPSPAFARLPATRVAVDGAVFSVRHTRFEAEAIRLNFAAGATHGDMVFRGAKAMVLASGCAVVPASLEGDETLVRADLDCPGTGPHPPRREKPLELDCAFTGAVADGDFRCTALR